MSSVIYTDGDLFLGHHVAIVNPVNCYGVMGKGLALAFKKRYPAYFQHYASLCRQGEVRIGTLTSFDVESTHCKSLKLISFPTKNHWKDPSQLPWIEKGLISLRELILEEGITNIGIPMLGCGYGGLNWDEVRPLIEKHLSRLEFCEVYVYGPMI